MIRDDIKLLHNDSSSICMPKQEPIDENNSENKHPDVGTNSFAEQRLFGLNTSNQFHSSFNVNSLSQITNSNINPMRLSDNYDYLRIKMSPDSHSQNNQSLNLDNSLNALRNGLQFSLDNSQLDSMNSLDNQGNGVVRTRRRKAGINDEDRVCVVCGEPASGYNFDRLTCESCKAFFRRNALKPRDKIKKCNRHGQCNIEGSQRKHCPSCRLEKCLAAGMKKELILPPEKLEQRAKPRRRKNQSVNDDGSVSSPGGMGGSTSGNGTICLENGSNSGYVGNGSNSGRFSPLQMHSPYNSNAGNVSHLMMSQTNNLTLAVAAVAAMNQQRMTNSGNNNSNPVMMFQNCVNSFNQNQNLQDADTAKSINGHYPLSTSSPSNIFNSNSTNNNNNNNSRYPPSNNNSTINPTNTNNNNPSSNTTSTNGYLMHPNGRNPNSSGSESPTTNNAYRCNNMDLSVDGSNDFFPGYHHQGHHNNQQNNNLHINPPRSYGNQTGTSINAKDTMRSPIGGHLGMSQQQQHQQSVGHQLHQQQQHHVHHPQQHSQHPQSHGELSGGGGSALHSNPVPGTRSYMPFRPGFAPIPSNGTQEPDYSKEFQPLDSRVISGLSKKYLCLKNFLRVESEPAETTKSLLEMSATAMRRDKNDSTIANKTPSKDPTSDDGDDSEAGQKMCRHFACRRWNLRRARLSKLTTSTETSNLFKIRDPPKLPPDSRLFSALSECVQRIREPFTPSEHLETKVAETLEQEYNRMDSCIRRIIKVVKLLPFFNDIGRPAQLGLLRANIYGLIVLYSSFFFERNIRKLRYPVLQNDGNLNFVTVSMMDEVTSVKGCCQGSSPSQTTTTLTTSPNHLGEAGNYCVKGKPQLNLTPTPTKVTSNSHKTANLRADFELYKTNTLSAFDLLDKLTGSDDTLRVALLAVKLFSDDSLPSEYREAVSQARRSYLLFLWTYLRWNSNGPLYLINQRFACLLLSFVDLRTLESRMTEFAKLLSLDGLSPLMREVCSQKVIPGSSSQRQPTSTTTTTSNNYSHINQMNGNHQHSQQQQQQHQHIHHHHPSQENSNDVKGHHHHHHTPQSTTVTVVGTPTTTPTTLIKQETADSSIMH